MEDMNGINESNSTFDNCDNFVDVKPVLQDLKVEFEYDSRFENPKDEWKHPMFYLQPDEKPIKEEYKEEIHMNEVAVNWNDELEESQIDLPMPTTSAATADPLSLDDFTSSEVEWQPSRDFVKVEHVDPKTEFKCDRAHCQKIFSEESELIEHIMSTHHYLTKWKCAHCPEQFPFQKLLLEHEKTHPVVTIYSCAEKKCRRRFISKEGFIQHLITHQPKPTSSEDLEFQNVKIVQKVVHHTCRFCQALFRSNTMLGKHLETHAGEKPLTCEHCQKTFVRISEWHAHFLQMSSVGRGKHAECPKCDQTFPFKCALAYHLKNFVHEKIYECEYCPKSFHLKIELDVHLKYHKRAKFTCEMCQRSFVRKDTLGKHKLIHTRQQRFKCDLCGSSYVTDTGLIRHQQQKHKKT